MVLLLITVMFDARKLQTTLVISSFPAWNSRTFRWYYF